jgi:hypothetical protein
MHSTSDAWRQIFGDEEQSTELCTNVFTTLLRLCPSAGRRAHQPGDGEAALLRAHVVIINNEQDEESADTCNLVERLEAASFSSTVLNEADNSTLMEHTAVADVIVDLKATLHDEQTLTGMPYACSASSARCETLFDTDTVAHRHRSIVPGGLLMLSMAEEVVANTEKTLFPPDLWVLSSATVCQVASGTVLYCIRKSSISCNTHAAVWKTGALKSA